MGKRVRNHHEIRELDSFISILKQHRPELAKRYKVKSLGIFGSYVRNEQTRRSDLDILVDFSETPDLFEFMDLEQHLASLLGIKVDLVTPRALKGTIGRRILSEVVFV